MTDPEKIKSFSVTWFMTSLASKSIYGIKATSKFLNEIVWGDGEIGTVRILISPNYRISIEKKIFDAENHGCWILKKILMPKLKEYAGSEDIIADEVFSYVISAYEDKQEMPNDTFNLLELINFLTAKMKEIKTSVLNYSHLKTVNDNYYIMNFALTSSGVGLLGTSLRSPKLTPKLDIELFYDRKKGLIKCIAHTISIVGDGNSFKADVPLLLAWFSPEQKRHEVARCITNVLKFF